MNSGVPENCPVGADYADVKVNQHYEIHISTTAQSIPTWSQRLPSFRKTTTHRNAETASGEHQQVRCEAPHWPLTLSVGMVALPHNFSASVLLVVLVTIESAENRNRRFQTSIFSSGARTYKGRDTACP